MLTISLIREKKEFIAERLKIKNFDAKDLLEKIIALDAERRDIQTRTDLMQGEANKIAKEVGALMMEGKKSEAEAAKEKTYKLKEEIKALERELQGD